MTYKSPTKAEREWVTKRKAELTLSIRQLMQEMNEIAQARESRPWHPDSIVAKLGLDEN